MSDQRPRSSRKSDDDGLSDRLKSDEGQPTDLKAAQQAWIRWRDNQVGTWWLHLGGRAVIDEGQGGY